MLVSELLNPPPREVLLEGTNLAVFEALLPLLLLEENGEGGFPDVADVPEVAPAPAPSYTVFRPGGMGMNANHWLNELTRTLRNLAVASNIKKRLRELGVKGEGEKRVSAAAKNAAKQARDLLSNPWNTAYRIPVWRTGAPPKTRIKVWNEALERALRDELAGLDLP